MQRTDEITLKAPNGATLTEHYHAHETVGKVLEQAVEKFGREGQLDPSKQYMLVLNGTSLENQLTLEAAGVRPGDVLNVRSKRIPGDGDASGVL